MFQEGTDRALDDQLQRPTLRPNPTPGFWANSLTALPRGIGAGTAEGIAFGSELAGAFGDVLSATGTASTTGMFSTQSTKERQESDAARQRMLDSQTPYSNETGDLFRQRAKEIMPDPQATGAAGNVLAGVARFGTKAVAYTLGGNPFGAVPLGMDEALTESDRLKQQGVDLGTRAQAGAVAGTVAGASMLAPMSGASALIRFGKGAAVGEVSMIAQSAAEKAILEHAGYDKIGSTFDPFDPVALAVGLIPGALGAKFGHTPAKPSAAGMKPLESMGLGERQALPYNDVRLDAYTVEAARRVGVPSEALLALKNAGEKSGPTATSPVGARGVMQFMPETWKAYGRGDIADPVNSIDAGARYLKDLLQQYDGDVRAALAHYNGGSKAGRAVHEGGAPPAAETQAYLARTDAYLAERGGEQGGRAHADDPDAVAAARVNQVVAAMEDSRLTPAEDVAGRTAHQDALEAAHDQMAGGEPVNVAERLTLPQADPIADAPHAGLAVVEQRDVDLVRTAAAADQLAAARQPPEAPRQRPAAPRETEGEPASRPPPQQQPSAGAAESSVTPAGPSQAHLDMHAAEVARLSPDLLVHLEGMEAPARVGDLLERVREEAANEAKEAPLVKVAAACFLRS